MADNLFTIKRKFTLNKTENKLINKYWPGALTIVLKNIKPKSDLRIKILSTSSVVSLPNAIFVMEENINKGLAVRISSDKLMRQLAKECAGFVSSTSANVTGEKECLSGLAVYRQFKKRKYQPDLILDIGKLKNKKPSTIVSVSGQKISIIRQGEIKIKPNNNN